MHGVPGLIEELPHLPITGHPQNGSLQKRLGILYDPKVPYGKPASTEGTVSTSGDLGSINAITFPRLNPKVEA